MFSWETLATAAGLAAATAALTQVAKKFLDKANPKFVALIVATVLSAGVLIFWVGEISPENVIIAIVNALVATTSSMGIYDSVIKPNISHGEDH